MEFEHHNDTTTLPSFRSMLRKSMVFVNNNLWRLGQKWVFTLYSGYIYGFYFIPESRLTGKCLNHKISINMNMLAIVSVQEAKHKMLKEMFLLYMTPSSSLSLSQHIPSH